ncbi:MAG: adenylate/guanylate cyclase domain-containing protein [Hyphomicrobiaceae bacterium]
MATDRVKRRLAAVLALDVAGFSRLMGEDEVGTLAALVDCRRNIVEPLVSGHNGRIVKLTGDGALIEFSSAVDAVECGAAIQSAFADRNAAPPDEKTIQLRIGINLGDVILEHGDIYGDGVNIAARLEALTEPGGLCISGTVFDQIDGKVEIAFEDLGLQSVKNIAHPVRIYQMRSKDSKSLVAAGPPVIDRPSLAILPLDDLSTEKEQQFFCDAVAEDLTTALSRFDWLFVAARNAAFAYRGQAVDIKRVGIELGVRYVLEGSVRQIGQRVRVNVQLIDAESLGHLWADRIDREIDDIFALQDDVVGRIASTVAPEIIQAEITRSRRRLKANFGPWDHYLQAVDHYYAMTTDDIEQAIHHLEEAVKVDPQFAAAYALRSLCETHAAARGWHRPVKTAYQIAERFAELAVRLSPTSPETNEAHSFVLLCTGRSREAAIVAQRSVELNPYFARAHAVLGHALVHSGDPEAALSACKKGLRSTSRDQRGSWLFDALGHIYFFLGQFEEAIDVSHRALQHDPSLFGAMVTLACANAQLGRRDEARQAVDRLVNYIPGFSLQAVRKNPMFSDPAFAEKLIQSLELAGLPE